MCVCVCVCVCACVCDNTYQRSGFPLQSAKNNRLTHTGEWNICRMGWYISQVGRHIIGGGVDTSVGGWHPGMGGAWQQTKGVVRPEPWSVLFQYHFAQCYFWDLTCHRKIHPSGNMNRSGADLLKHENMGTLQNSFFGHRVATNKQTNRNTLYRSKVFS